MSTLNELFLEELADLYDAEKQLAKALPKMAKAASSPELRQAFESHLGETKNHVARLEEVFSAMDEKPTSKTCPAMQGLIEEGEEIIEEYDATPVRDAALICAAQKVEHYEIASYGCLCTWAEILDNDRALELLQETMNEEEQADEKLTELAETSINLEAADSDDLEEETSDKKHRSK